ncbi:MAG: hypothetical protein R6V58_17855, partial [Planctomycetota bacterium]
MRDPMDPGVQLEAQEAAKTEAGGLREGEAGQWHPPVDIIEGDSSWWIEVALPGADSESLQLKRDV